MKTEFKRRFSNLLKVKGTPTAKIGRGQDFEVLINDVFEDEGILLQRSYHTSDNRSEQIDGAIEVLNRVILFEVKWVESGLAASDLYAFIGKIENKLIGTLGLFISKEELTENFINSLSKGRRRNVLLLHGKDVELLFSRDISLRDYFGYCIRRYSFDNIIHYDVMSFLQGLEKSAALNKSDQVYSSGDSDGIKKILKTLFSDIRIEEYTIDLELQKLNSEEKRQLACYLLEKYPKYYDAYISSLFSKKHRNQLTNMTYALSELVKQKNVVNNIVHKYFELYCDSASERYLEGFLWEPFKNGYESIDDKTKFQSILYKNFEKIIGDYDKENLLTKVVKDIWPTIDKQFQDQFLNEYIEIFFSSRKDGYDQKRFARELVNKKENKRAIKKWIESKIKKEIESSDLGVDDIPNEVNYFTRRYNDVVNVLDIDESEWQKYVRRLYRANVKAKSNV
jgi:hypothetical protein